MKDKKKTKRQLITELEEMRQRIAELKDAGLQEPLEVSEDKYRALLEGLNDAVFVHPLKKDGYNNFIDVNERACERLRYSRDELLALSPKDISAPEDARLRRSRDGRKKLLENKREIFRATHLAKNRTRIPVEISSRILLLEGRSVVLSLARDISSRVQTEKEIKFRNKELAALNKISIKLNESLNMDSVLKSTLAQIVKVADVDGAESHLLNTDGNLALAMTWNLDQSFVLSSRDIFFLQVKEFQD